MSLRTRERRLRPLRVACFALYAVILVAAPFTHHDLACHFKTPQHCTACASSQLGASPHAPALPGAWLLADAGSAVADVLTAGDTLLTVRRTGRSPPALL
jgi:hypothetical protein